MIKVFTYAGLTHLWAKLKDKFVAKEVGKGLSTNDYTSAEKQKLAGLKNYTLPKASNTVLGGVKVGTGLDVNAEGLVSLGDHQHAAADVTGLAKVATTGKYADLTGTPSIPTDNSQLANGAGYQNSEQVEAAITGKGYQTAQQVESAISGKGYQTAGQVETAITKKGYQTAAQVQQAISGAGHLKRSIVAQLPAVGTADPNTIYMVKDAGASGDNIYVEWMAIDGAWERTGSTDVDLSGYIKDEDMQEITNDEIDQILAS